MSIFADSPSDETLNRGPLALRLRRQYEFPFGINIVQFSFSFFFFTIGNLQYQDIFSPFIYSVQLTPRKGNEQTQTPPTSCFPASHEMEGGAICEYTGGDIISTSVSTGSSTVSIINGPPRVKMEF